LKGLPNAETPVLRLRGVARLAAVVSPAAVWFLATDHGVEEELDRVPMRLGVEFAEEDDRQAVAVDVVGVAFGR